MHCHMHSARWECKKKNSMDLPKNVDWQMNRNKVPCNIKRIIRSVAWNIDFVYQKYSINQLRKESMCAIEKYKIIIARLKNVHLRI